ncbi:MAG: DUF3090 domain-containing protein [Chloroflexota bacterium]
MARRLFVFDAPDRFVAGTVGEPGGRSFYLQARKGAAVVSVSLEKTQVAVLADWLGDLLDTIEPVAPAAVGANDRKPLDEPVVEVFRVGAMALAWDPANASVVVEAQPLGDAVEYHEVPDDDPDGPDVLRVRISAVEARAFVDRSLALVGAGRPSCPFCGMPLEPTGHYCTNARGRLN